MELQLLTVLVSVLVSGPLLAKGACPDGSQIGPKLVSCLSQLNNLTDFSKGPITVTRLNDYCSSSARTTEIQCVENIINECREASSDTRRILDKAVNVDAIRGSVKILCNNAQVFADTQDCIGRYQSSVTSCIATENANYITQIQALQAEASVKGAEWFEEKLYEELCNYVSGVDDCQMPYGQNCGREIGDVFDALVHAATPPVCAKYIYNSGVFEHANLALLISLAVVAAVKGKW